jgi:hypothetical protein
MAADVMEAMLMSCPYPHTHLADVKIAIRRTAVAASLPMEQLAENGAGG